MFIKRKFKTKLKYFLKTFVRKSKKHLLMNKRNQKTKEA
jgi:hypothetical protein